MKRLTYIVALMGICATVIPIDPTPSGAATFARGTQSFGRLERPPGQAHVASTTSYIQRTITWPTAAWNEISFDYFVDSEESYDFLKFYVDGVVQASWSGLGKSGNLTAPVPAGTHTIRFEYVKDVSVDRGRDTAWVDNITARSKDVGVVESWAFDWRADTLASWTVGGAAGGFVLGKRGDNHVLRRPASQAFTGYQASATTSSIQRTFTVSGTDNRAVFRYLVDSEQNYDYLKLYVDGVLNWSVSGYTAGTQVVSLPAGSHTLKFEYYKDTSVDVGRDTAMIDDFQVLSDGSGVIFDDLDGTAIGAALDGWTVSSGAGWVIADAPPLRADLSEPDPTTPPVLDGNVHDATNGEWAKSTAIPFADVVSTQSKRGNVYLRKNSADNSLYLGVRVARATPASGGEAGTFTLLLDASRSNTLKTFGCGPTATSPSIEDRKVVLTYTSTSASVQQYAGNCNGGWSAIANGSPDQWPFAFAYDEPPFDPDFVHFEFRLSLLRAADTTSTAFTEGVVGFAMTHENTAGLITGERFPPLPGEIVSDLDVASWSTLYLTSSPTQSLGLDAYVFPRAGRSMQ